jgi:hypothetical protein
MKNQRYSKKQFDSKIKSGAMNYYDARFRNMSTQFDAGYCKGVLDTIFLMLNILNIQCTKEFIFNQQRSA